VIDTDRPPEAVREAFVLPALFLTVALLGGFRTIPGSGGFRFLTPPLVTLVLATLLLSLLASSGVLAFARLMGAHRTGLQNLTGVVLMLALFAAAAQLFNLVTPEGGLLRVVFDVVLVVLLVNTAAAAPDRARALRSVVVIFGSAFVVKFVLLDSLRGPSSGMWYRVATAIFEGATLGSFAYAPSGAATGYIAFFTLALFVVGLVLLPRAGDPYALASRAPHSSEIVQ
jgi:hypothetical protein